MDCSSSTDRCLTSRDSVFLVEIARTCRICSGTEGTRYSIKCMKDVYLKITPELLQEASERFRKNGATAARATEDAR